MRTNFKKYDPWNHCKNFVSYHKQNTLSKLRIPLIQHKHKGRVII